MNRSLDRLLPTVVLFTALNGCASTSLRDLRENEILQLGKVEIENNHHRNLAAYDITASRSGDEWRVSAMPKCGKKASSAPLPPESAEKIELELQLADLEETTVLCAGGDIHLTYGRNGKLLDTYIGQ